MVNFLTQQDVQDYGSDLVDFAQRAAAHAMAPHLQDLNQQNAELRHRLAVEARARLDQRVAEAVLDFRTIDGDPRWHQWLRSVDLLSGRVRQTLLDEAIADANAPRVISFFKNFLREAGVSNPSTAFGRAGSNQITYTRGQIAALYAAHRRGAYRGREDAWAAQERDIIDAARTGRVIGPDTITK